jgi:bifunctional non-homologous end joining protein LigD
VSGKRKVRTGVGAVRENDRRDEGEGSSLEAPRRMRDPFGKLPDRVQRSLVERRPPSWIDPMLATLTARRFSDPGWIFEPKFDGVRCLSFRHDGGVRLMSRNRLSANDRYPEIAEALAAQDAADFIVDGEVVAFEGNRTSFARLQRRMQVRDPNNARRSGVPVYYYVFDVLYAGGFDVTGLPLRDRKALLRGLFSFKDPVRFTAHRNADGVRYWEQACRRGLEGVIAKRADSPYVPGRSGHWLKFKCVNEQEFVIGGFTDPKGSRHDFGALLIGYHRDGDLVFAGKVGTGFDDETLRTLGRRLRALEQERPPFTAGRLPRKGVHWVRPELVGQIGFTEWTRDGQLRHPRFLGQRDDKAAREVVREMPT